MILIRSNIRKKTSYNYSSGFALPTILIASMIMLSVLLVSVASTAAIRVSLLSQTYNQMAQTAGDAGVVYTKACLDANGGVPLWSDAKPLGPNTDCSGNQLSGFTCPASSVDSRCYITVNSSAPTAQVLVVGGGGGGGEGGGGAGGVLTSSSTLVAQTYSIIVGGGGSGSADGAAVGANGSNSSAFGLVAIGGGIGGVTSSVNGAVGGSGGGGRRDGAGTGGSATSGQGNVGGGTTGAQSWKGGAGGGGAGAVGIAGSGNVTAAGETGGNGGIGVVNTITGSSVYYAAGGGGAVEGSGGSASQRGIGGLGGGGSGFSNQGTVVAATSGTVNTGGGGGGRPTVSGSGTAGAGGSGIVIISYPTSSITATVTGSVTTSTSGSNTIQKFTGNGTFTVTSAGSGAVTSSFSVGLPTLVNGKAAEINSVGSTKLLRSSTGTAWRTYSQSSRFTIPPVTTKVLVVAGGGSGGGSSGTSIGSGGGGAGGLVYNDSYNITASSYTVTVGNGGIGVPGFKAGNNGQNSSFVPTGSTTYGSSSATAGKSCYSLKLDGINTDGAYWIDPDGAGSNTPFQVYCDMTNNGGGWTMMMKSTRSTTFNYYSSYWTTSNTLNTANTDTNDGDAKFRSFNEYPVRDLMARWPDINSGTWRWLQKDFNDATPITLPTFFSTANLKFFGDAKNFSGWSNGIFSSQVDIRFYGFNYVNNKTNGVNANARWGFGWNENSEGLYVDPSTLNTGGAPGSDDVSGGIGMDSSFGNYSAGDVISCCNDTAGINRSARVEVYGRNTNDQPDSISSISAVGGGYGGTWTISPTLGGSGGGAGENGQSLDGAAGISGQGNAGGNDNGYDGGAPSAAGGGGGAGSVGGNSTTNTIGGNGGIGIANSISGNSIYYAGGGGGAGSSTMGSGGNGGGGNGKGVTTGTGTAGTANTGAGGGGSLTNAAEAAQPGGAGGSGVVIISYPTGSITATGGTITTSGGNTIHTFTSSGNFRVGPIDPTYGSGADGVITVAAGKNLNTDTLATGRTCADAINYSITALSINTATLSTTPAAGCLVAGDEVLLIDLQGISANYGNVGNYETLRIQSISTNVITFTANKTKYYGNGASDDTNIGTATTNQRVMLQRVPNYTDVTVNSGITLTANAWDGTKGGVLFFRANGSVSIVGTININGKGWRGGAGDVYYGGAGESYNGGPVATSPNANGGGGGGGNSHGIMDGGTGAPGGAGFATAGTNGGAGRYGYFGYGGASYGAADLSKVYFGSGGGGNAVIDWADYNSGGIGGGIVIIYGLSTTISGSISANGTDGVLTSHQTSGGSGGSIYIKGGTVTVGSNLVKAKAGASGDGASGAPGNSGPSSAGRIRIDGTLTGTTNPTTYTP